MTLLTEVDAGYLDDGDHSTPPLPPECERCGTEFGSVKPYVANEHGDKELSGAALIGGRWVCVDCERPELDDYLLDATTWIAVHEDNQFESQREEAF